MKIIVWTFLRWWPTPTNLQKRLLIENFLFFKDIKCLYNGGRNMKPCSHLLAFKLNGC
jgi:hypothetical protein